MSRGLYTIASSMVAQMNRQAALAGALANISTAGYKADLFRTRSFPSVFLRAAQSGGLSRRHGALGSGVIMDDLGPDLRQGTLIQTDGALDLAIDGPGFFVVRDQGNNVRLTRDGHFLAAADGSLATSEGFVLLSDRNDPINVGGGSAVKIARTGEVFVDGAPVATIKFATAPADALLRAGGTSLVLKAGQTLESAQAQVVQGSLEGSNVNTTALLTQMISVARAYESAQRVFEMENRILGQSVNDVGRV